MDSISVENVEVEKGFKASLGSFGFSWICPECKHELSQPVSPCTETICPCGRKWYIDLSAVGVK